MPKDQNGNGDNGKQDLFSHVNIDKVRKLRPLKIDYSRVRKLELIDKNNRKSQTFKEYQRIVPSKKLKATEKARPSFVRELRYLKDFSILWYLPKKVLVLVNSTLLASIQASIDQYVADLAYEGYWAEVHAIAGGTPAELRNFIKSRNPLGVVMVGSLPTAWFEMSDDFFGPAEFPCDLYYMDLTGTWNDPDGDGKFSEHPTNVAPEIWVGRIWTPTADGNDAALINNYFARNHAYRKGLFGYSDKALAFVEDDWIGFGDCAFDSMFVPSNIETVTDPTATTGARYKAEVQQHRAWAQINAHSSPGGHSISAPSGGEWIPSAYLRDTIRRTLISTTCLPVATRSSRRLTTWQVGTSSIRMAARSATASQQLAAPRQGRCFCSRTFMDQWVTARTSATHLSTGGRRSAPTTISANVSGITA